jgi:hypothetical protein
MRSVSGGSIGGLVAAAALPIALLLAANTAGAQWSAQRPQQQSQRYPQQRYPNQSQASGYGSQQELFVWQGRVDKEIRIQMSGNRASVVQIGNHERVNGGVRSFADVPRQDGVITVQQLEGRGTVDIVQQPERSNGYTAIVRLRDPQSGAGTYRVAAYWQPTGNSGAYGSESRRGNGNGDRDRDGSSHDNGRRGHDH